MNVVESLFFYFMVFCISIFFSKILSSLHTKVSFVGHFSKVYEHVIRFIFFILTILPLVIIFTYRNDVGTDYRSYKYIYDYQVAKGGGIDSIFTTGEELGYALVNVLGYQIFHSYQGSLLIASILILVPALLGIILYDPRHLPIGWCIYVFTLYPSSFNGIQQHIVVAFSLLSVVLAYKNRYVYAVLLVILGCFFHFLSLFSFVFLFLIKYEDSRHHPEKIEKLHFLFIIVLCAGVFAGVLFRILAYIPLFAHYYYKYIYTFADVTVLHFITHTIFKLPLTVVLFIYAGKLVQNNVKNFMLILFTFFDYAFIFSSYYIRWAIRMQYFSMVAAPLIIMSLLAVSKYHKDNYFAIKYGLLLTYVFRFFIIFGYSRYDGIVPYAFI